MPTVSGVCCSRPLPLDVHIETQAVGSMCSYAGADPCIGPPQWHKLNQRKSWNRVLAAISTKRHTVTPLHLAVGCWPLAAGSWLLGQQPAATDCWSSGGRVVFGVVLEDLITIRNLAQDSVQFTSLGPITIEALGSNSFLFTL